MLNQNVEKNLEQFNGRRLGRYRACSFICRGGQAEKWRNDGEIVWKVCQLKSSWHFLMIRNIICHKSPAEITSFHDFGININVLDTGSLRALSYFLKSDVFQYILTLSLLCDISNTPFSCFCVDEIELKEKGNVCGVVGTILWAGWMWRHFIAEYVGCDPPRRGPCISNWGL